MPLRAGAIFLRPHPCKRMHTKTKTGISNLAAGTFIAVFSGMAFIIAARFTNRCSGRVRRFTPADRFLRRQATK